MEKSKVWKYFSKIKDEGLAQCLRCPKKISMKSSNTSGLVRHLEHIHKMTRREIDGDDEIDVEEQSSEPQPKKSKSSVQQTLSFATKNKQSLAEIVATLAAKDGLTIRQITRSEFIRDSLNSKGFKLPKNETGVMKQIFQYYEEQKKETIKFLHNLRNTESARFSLSVDEWTSLRNRRYFNVCIHHTDGALYNLGLVYIPGQCRAIETRQIIEKRLDEFGLIFEQDVVAVSSDGPMLC